MKDYCRRKDRTLKDMMLIGEEVDVSTTMEIYWPIRKESEEGKTKE